MAGLSTKYGFGEYNKSRAEQKREMNVGDNAFGQYSRNIPNNAPDVAPQQAQQVAPMQAPGVNDMPDKSLYTKTPEQMQQNAVAEKAQAQQREVQRQQGAVEKFNTQQPAEKDPQGVERPTNPKDIADMVYGKRIDPVSTLRSDANIVRDNINEDIEPQEVERKHGWRDWFRNTGDEEYENRKRERIAAFSDMIRHLANLHYVNQYATPQHIESAYGKVKAEEKEQRKLKREQAKEDRRWNWKVSEAQRDQYNKDRTYGLGVSKDKREEALQPEKLKKAQEAAAAEEAKKRAEQAKATKLSAEAEYADEIASNKAKEQESKAALAAARVATEKARAAKVAQEGKNAKLRGQELTAKIRSQYSKDHDFFDTNDKRYEWAIPKSQRDLVFNELRSIAHKKGWGKTKGSGGSELDKYMTKSDETDRELLREALSKKGDPEVQQFFKRHGVLVESNWESNEAIRKDIKKRDEDKKRKANGGRGIK